MITEYEEERDYEMLKSWWMSHGWEAVHPGLLKPLGVIVVIEDLPTVAGFLYPVAGCGLAIMEWTVSNPEAKPFGVVKGIKELTKFFIGWCEDNDYQILMTTCKQESLGKIHQKNGFTRTDESMIHLAMVLEGGK